MRHEKEKIEIYAGVFYNTTCETKMSTMRKAEHANEKNGAVV